MDEKISELAVKVAEADQRARSNTHAINDIKEGVKELQKKQEAIYELTMSVRSIAQSMEHIGEGVMEVKEGQKKLEAKVENLGMQVDRLDNKVDAVDSKTKIDFALAIKENFWKITAALIGLTGIAKLLTILFKLG